MDSNTAPHHDAAFSMLDGMDGVFNHRQSLVSSKHDEIRFGRKVQCYFHRTIQPVRKTQFLCQDGLWQTLIGSSHVLL